MRTYTTEHTVYSFAELSEEAKDKAISKLWDLNVDHYWWSPVYENAKDDGFEIEEFNLDRGNNRVSGGFMIDEKEAAQKILENWSADSDLGTIATRFLEKMGSSEVEYDRNEDPNAEAIVEFEDNIAEEYQKMLKHEYEMLTSREVIIETIEANEYEFTADGELV